MIGTRPDCLPDGTARFIAEYQRDGFELWVELGMQSSHDRSLDYLGRHHSMADTIAAAERAHLYGIPMCFHVILGIPGETWH
ncbi:MAG TPA: radical SAM protein, partial [Spirochaetota bacterium]|nr:radical SAM protein [Spirochaetota bacterium]